MIERDFFHRCKICKKLFRDDECITDEVETKGLKCPDGCEETFIQPPYELPTQ